MTQKLGIVSDLPVTNNAYRSNSKLFMGILVKPEGDIINSFSTHGGVIVTSWAGGKEYVSYDDGASWIENIKENMEALVTASYNRAIKARND